MTPRLLLLVALLPLPTLWLPADPPAGPKVDRFGDPLPEGAIARLGTVRFRDVGVGEAVAYSPDGTRLVTASRDGVAVWDARDGRRLHAVPRPEVPADLEEHYDVPTAVAVAADGRFLAHGAAGGKVHLVALADGATETLDLGGATPGTLAFAPDGRYLVVVDRYHVRVVPLDGGPPTQVWPIRPDPPPAGRVMRGPIFGPGALSPNGKVLAVAGIEVRNGRCGDLFTRPRQLHLWDVATGEELQRLDLEVSQVAFHPAGTFLAALVGCEVVLLDPTTGDRVGGWDAPYGEGAPTLAVSPDGTWLTANGHLYDVATGEALAEIGRGVGLAFAPDGRHVAVAKEIGGAVVVRDALTGRDTQPRAAHDHALTDVHALPDGRSVATVGYDEAIRIWDARTGEPLRAIAAPTRTTVTVTLAGRWAAWLNAGVLEVQDLTTGRRVHRHAVGAESARLALSDDGRTLLRYSPGEGEMIHVHDVATGRVRARIDLDCDLTALAIAPDGTAAAVATRVGTVRLYDATTGGKRAELYASTEASDASACAVAFSPDGRLLASSRGDTGEIRLWDVTTGRCVRLGPGHGLRAEGEGVIHVRALTFTADGRLVVSVGADGSYRAWETASLRERSRWDDPGTRGVAVAGRHLLAALHQPTDAVVRDLADAAALPGGVAALWEALASDHPGKAYRAGRSLAAMPVAVAFLRERLHPVRPVEPARVRAWIADLDAEAFETRERAWHELARLGEAAVPALEAARRANPGPDLKRRLDALLDDRLGPPHPDRLRALRAIEVLEDVATRPARAILQSLATGAPDAEETRQAKAALGRLGTRP